MEYGFRERVRNPCRMQVASSRSLISETRTSSWHDELPSESGSIQRFWAQDSSCWSPPTWGCSQTSPQAPTEAVLEGEGWLQRPGVGQGTWRGPRSFSHACSRGGGVPHFTTGQTLPAQGSLLTGCVGPQGAQMLQNRGFWACSQGASPVT